ncbi:MAG: translation elongation factor Ts [Candidatus Zambryskibacteria bacterium]|nr:translation elongation factor Ts [Candidatus Zambryskibacteria bacterium]
MITTELVKKLRDMTGISVMQCKKALEEAGGDLEKATVLLQKKSAGQTLKKSGRTLGAGVISSYVHATGNVGSMVELLCETDFVAKNEEFKTLARDIAMHATAMNPEDEKAIMEEPFIKNPEVTVKNLLEQAIAKFGERIELSRFVRYSVSN